MNIYLATDHAGFELKERVKAFLLSGAVGSAYRIVDCGAEVFDATDDYPVFIARAAAAVARNSREDRAIVFGHSGQGEAMVSNRFPGVRATVWYGGTDELNRSIITLSREHNDANVLSIGAAFVNIEQATFFIDLWLSIPFSGEERHSRRIEEIERAFWDDPDLSRPAVYKQLNPVDEVSLAPIRNSRSFLQDTDRSSIYAGHSKEEMTCQRSSKEKSQ